MGTSQELGSRGERLAERFLSERGYEIIERNYRFGHREIDLIVRRGSVVAFVEVKTRGGAGFGHPLEAITAAKRREVERVAQRWLQSHRRPGLSYRFDALGIVLRAGRDPVVCHIPGAWRLGE
ncbi:MAG: YraN family protein [Gemmatimonadota bacterium]|nr:MAG: YraN family protein [Gemmatimonadota bacterium]